MPAAVLPVGAATRMATVTIATSPGLQRLSSTDTCQFVRSRRLPHPCSADDLLAHQTSNERRIVNLIDLLGDPAAAGLFSGATLGALALTTAVATKYWLDRDLIRPNFNADRALRVQARQQRRALASSRVTRGVPAGGQFAAHTRADGDIGLN